MATTYINIPKCPQCAHQLQVITDGQVGEVWALGYYVRGTARPLRLVNRDFLVCMHCEFAITI